MGFLSVTNFDHRMVILINGLKVFLLLVPQLSVTFNSRAMRQISDTLKVSGLKNSIVYPTFKMADLKTRS